MNNRRFVDVVENCCNYTVLGSVITRTVESMRRFKGVPKDHIVSTVFTTLKERSKTNISK